MIQEVVGRRNLIVCRPTRVEPLCNLIGCRSVANPAVDRRPQSEGGARPQKRNREVIAAGNQQKGETEQKNGAYSADLRHGRVGQIPAVCTPNECLQGRVAIEAVSVHWRVSDPLSQVRLGPPVLSHAR